MTKVAETLTEAGECCAGTIAGALDKAGSALANVGNDLLKSAPVERARAGVQAVDAYAHKSPWAVIGGVAVCALALGLLLQRR